MSSLLPVADRWFDRQSLDDGVTLLSEPHVDPLMRCNIWHVRGRDRDLMIDTGMGLASLVEAARDLIGKPIAAVATHVHADHIGGHHEFAERIVHRLEAEGLASMSGAYTLIDERFDPFDLASLNIEGYEVSGSLVTALPRPGHDLSAFRLVPAPATRIVEEGDRLDLGDRSFEVLHLPGHSPGGIGLWEASSGVLFSGDALYDGELIDRLHHSDRRAYAKTMARLRELPVRVVHAGHCPSFGRDRLVELVDAYLASLEAAGP